MRTKLGQIARKTGLSGNQGRGTQFVYCIGEYPDFILGEKVLLDADALIPIDEYWDDYPNIRNYLSEEQWERFRQEDGHIYWIPQFCVSQERMLK